MLLLLSLLACGDKDDSSVPDDWDSANQVLVNSCAFSSCHGEGQSGLTLVDGDPDANYAEIVEVEAEDEPGEILVVPGDHAASYLWRKCAADAGISGDPMPPPDGLDSGSLAIIQAWIDAGASQD